MRPYCLQCLQLLSVHPEARYKGDPDAGSCSKWDLCGDYPAALPPESDDRTPWDALTEENGWELMVIDGVSEFPVYGASGGLMNEKIRYKMFKPAENGKFFDGRDLGRRDSLCVRVKVRGR